MFAFNFFPIQFFPVQPIISPERFFTALLRKETDVAKNYINQKDCDLNVHGSVPAGIDNIEYKSISALYIVIKCNQSYLLKMMLNNCSSTINLSYKCIVDTIKTTDGRRLRRDRSNYLSGSISKDTVLHLAVQTENLDHVNLLLSYAQKTNQINAVVNTPNIQGYTPLALAIIKNNESLVNILLSTDAVDFVELKLNYLTLAIDYKSNVSIIRSIFDYAKRHRQIDLILNKRFYNSDGVFCSILRSSNIDYIAEFHRYRYVDGSGSSILHIAMTFIEYLDNLKFIIDVINFAKKNNFLDKINVPNNYGLTPIMFAAIFINNIMKEDFEMIVDHLIFSPKDLFFLDSRLNSVFHLVCQAGNDYALKKLLSCIANDVYILDQKNFDGLTALDIAKQKGHESCVKVLDCALTKHKINKKDIIFSERKEFSSDCHLTYQAARIKPKK